jgi:hypothetical protein
MKHYATIVLLSLSLFSCSKLDSQQAQSSGNIKAELVNQNWDGLAAGIKFSYGGEERTLANDMAHIEVSIRIKNNSSEQVVVPKWILLDKNNHEFNGELGSFQLLDNKRKGFIDEDVFIAPNEIKLIYLRSPSNYLQYVRQREPLYLVDNDRKFKWSLSSMPDPSTLYKKYIEEGCFHSLKLTFEDRKWQMIPKGSEITASEGKFTLNEDMMVANLSIKVQNVAKTAVDIPPLFLVDNKKSPITKLIIENGERTSKKGVQVPSGETINIKLTMAMEPYDKLVSLEPLYIVDQNFTWLLELASITEK